jgi:ribonuclease R
MKDKIRDSEERREKIPLAKGRTAKDDVKAVMAQYGLPESFPRQVLKEARAVDEAGIAEAAKGRLDLRRKFVFTCDPATAKDFDDALSLETDRKGNRVLGVHIADVSHYVPAGSAIDREAFRRTTSVYLLNRVVPMLPEVLSNGVCSLVPGRDRLAFSVFLTFDRKGNCVARRFEKTVICSQARFTYERVMAIIRGASSGIPPRQAKTVRAVSELAQQLRARRFAAGALDIEVPETEILLDGEGNMTGLAERPYDESHQMVEECMVAANEAVAREMLTRGVKILSRLHEPPDPEKMEMLRADLAAIGVSCGDLSHGKNVAHFLKAVKSHPLRGTIGVMVLRSLKRACYDARKSGHFGLAKDFYAHFTSPICRYPDLTLHRQLADFVSGRGGKMPPNMLERFARRCSDGEERADEAERSLHEVKKFRFLEENGGEFDATVGKVTKFGLFVDVPALATGGLVHVSELSGRFVRYRDNTRTLDDGRRQWRIGDRLKVRVVKVDWNNRWVDFALADAEPSGGGRRGGARAGGFRRSRR